MDTEEYNERYATARKTLGLPEAKIIGTILQQKKMELLPQNQKMHKNLYVKGERWCRFYNTSMNWNYRGKSKKKGGDRKKRIEWSFPAIQLNRFRWRGKPWSDLKGKEYWWKVDFWATWLRTLHCIYARNE